MRLQWLDYLATLRERKTWLCAAMLVYAVVSIPVVLARPPEHVRDVVAVWLGSADPFILFMYVWIDLVMNKVIAFVPTVLASGVVLRERDIGVLPIVASKPLSMARYFRLRAVSACAVMATLHIATQLGGAMYFSWRVPGFRPGPFLLAMIPHLFAALFATAFAAAVGAWLKRRAASALVAVVVLSLMAGLALVGFYQPAWRTIVLVNPLTLGASALGSLGSLGPAALFPPVLALLGLCIGALAVGSVGYRRMEV